MSAPALKLGQRRVVSYGTVRVVECRCDASQIAIALPRPRGSLCQFCAIRNVKP